jgi:hypothetical protein
LKVSPDERESVGSVAASAAPLIHVNASGVWAFTFIVEGDEPSGLDRTDQYFGSGLGRFILARHATLQMYRMTG